MWNIVPGKSVGPFELGHEPDEYFDELPGAFDIFKRFPDSEDIYDFSEDRVHLTVDSENKIIEIAVFRPNEVYLGEVQLLNRPIQELALELNSTNYLFESVDVGLESDELGIVVVEVDELVDCVEVRKTDS